MSACCWRLPRLLNVLLALTLLSGPALGSELEPVRIGGKNFSEGYLLAEIVAQTLEAGGVPVERRFGLGGTLICYEALAGAEIDLYVEYSGTLAQAVLNLEGAALRGDVAQLNQALLPRGLYLLPPLGFNNVYAIAVKQSLAQARGLRSIGDLGAQTDLKLSFSHEFLERSDGWPGLARTYGLSQRPKGIEHGLAYQALDEGAIDVTDAYSTDGELQRYQLTTLSDDANYFPDYLAAPLVRAPLRERLAPLLAPLANSLTDQTMQALNAQVVFAGRSFAEVATDFLQQQGIVAPGAAVSDPGWQSQMLRNTLVHLKLTGLALGGAIVIALGLSLLIFRRQKLAQVVLYVASLLQTIPSIALLALMIPLFGIGVLPAVIALLLYALLPILRNSLTALTTVDPTLVRVARAMGLGPADQIRHLYLPIALPGIFAGVRTAAVICIGTATLAAFIGAGGLGDPIVTGLSLNNTRLILQGAIPAALLAVVTELLFEGLEWWLLPRHLRR
ncbi:MAG: glycine betaine ABC transporter substrate-binding protein [Pseudomonadales bacterium]